MYGCQVKERLTPVSARPDLGKYVYNNSVYVMIFWPRLSVRYVEESYMVFPDCLGTTKATLAMLGFPTAAKEMMNQS